MSYSQIEYIEASEYCSKVTDGTHDSPKKVDVGKKLITSKHLKEYSLDFDNAYLISQEDYDKVNYRSKVEQFDLLYSMIGTVGEVYLEKSPIIDYAVKNVGIFKVGNELDSKWLYYYLKSPKAKEYLLSHLSGSTQQYVTLGSLRKFPVPILEDGIRKQIVDILSSLDDKIELNNKINKNLEEMAQALYKQWFVDFEFLNEDGEPYKSSGGEMIESELGLIPKGWEVVRLKDELIFERGIEPGSKNYEDKKTIDNVSFYRVGDLNGDNHVYVNRKLLKDKFVNYSDVLVSFDGAIGRVGIGFEGSYSTGLRKIYSNSDTYKSSFLYFLFQSSRIQDTIFQHANGTTILHAGSAINHLEIPINNYIVERFVKLIDPLFDKLLELKSEYKYLRNIRNTLLPKLMSGEIEVPIEG